MQTVKPSLSLFFLLLLAVLVAPPLRAQEAADTSGVEASAGVPSVADTARGRGNPILGGVPAADPTVALFGDRYYVYATGAGASEEGFAAWSSPDLQAWTDKGMILRFADLAWKEEAERRGTWHGGAWAPDIAERNGTYYFYFSAGSNIGVAAGDRPDGPFTDALGRPLVPYRDDLSSIDPMAFIDDDGQAYLYWGAVPAKWLEGKVDTLYTHLFARRLGDDMTSLEGPERATISVGGDGLHIEGPYVFKREGTYYMTWSRGNYNAAGGEVEYRVMYATATAPMGPWKWAPNNPILHGRHALGIHGPGHNSVFRRPGTDAWYIAYHQHKGGDPVQRKVFVDRLHFNADGTIRPVTPTLEGVGVLPLEVAVEVAGQAPFQAGADMELSARVAWPEERVRRVTFLAGEKEVGEATRPPYRITWEDVPAGFYRLQARAMDREGRTSTSPARNVDVRPAPAEPVKNPRYE